MRVTLEFDPVILNIPEEGLDGKTLEEVFLETAFRFGRFAMEKFLRQLDGVLETTRPGGYVKEGTRVKTLSTRLGEIKLQRSYYRRKDGTYYYLLDDFLGWGKHQRATEGLIYEGMIQSAQGSYRKASAELEKQTTAPVSHECLRSRVKLVGGKASEVQDAKAKAVFERGVVPEAVSDVAKRLFVEVDGTYISVRRGGKVKKKEIKLCILYRGKEPRYANGSGNSFQLKDKYAFGGLYSSKALWERLSVFGEERYGLSGAEEIYWAGDGASWCWSGMGDYPVAVAHLCKYHMNREITKVFGNGRERSGRLRKLLETGEREKVSKFFSECLGEFSDSRKRKAVLGLARYISENWEGIQGWKVVRERLGEGAGLGAIEGNIDKVLASRFKDRGCCWSESGAQALAQVRLSWLNGELGQILNGLRLEGRRVEIVTPEEGQGKRRVLRGRAHYYRLGHLPVIRVGSDVVWQESWKKIQKGGNRVW